MAGDLLGTMADDLGIPRMHGEEDTSFVCRVSYSALRFWMQAFCLDDGFGGSYGISRPTIARKSAAWLRNLAGPYPDILEWYEHGAGMRRNLSDIARLLTDVSDLLETDNGLYRCTARHTVPLGTRSSLLLGLTDPTNLTSTGVPPMSGMMRLTGLTGEVPSLSAASINGTTRHRPSKRKAVITPTEDERYIAIDLSRPPSVSIQASRFNLLTWPVSSVDDASHRLARAEYGLTLMQLLESEGYAIVTR
ncbi:hypothetical protein [Bifidobacterium platyrrhinorum]|uniref:Uncharacterized protein n=1 Tax=Bifidobacterium platyrrhinorum TaxID=2661628 RepID=A0A6L9SPN8_9BIFI|nr:hypothetical protein [Bifidobacterium platyrrhinorum]NEG54490.1 hypothetical protein [Bifidobacterium platyrrhinorum]